MKQYSMCQYMHQSGLTMYIKNIAAHIAYSFALMRCYKNDYSSVVHCTENSLAVVCLASLGDLVVFCDAAQRLKESGKHLTLFCKCGNGTAEYARLTGLFDSIIELDINGINRFKNLKMLKTKEFDTVFSIPLGRHILPDLYVCAIKANNRYYPDTMQDCSLPSLKKKIDKRADKLIPITAVHELNRYEEFLSGCGLYKGELKPFILSQGTPCLSKTLAVFPGAGGGDGKQWSASSFAFVAKELVSRGIIDNVLILGTNNDAGCCEAMYNELEGQCAVENLCGTTDIKILTEIISQCRLTLANDSGSAHISISCGVPTVVVCGMWQYGRFYPNLRLDSRAISVFAGDEFRQSCNSSFPQCSISPAPCISCIKREAVLETAVRILSENNGKENQC